MTRDTRYIHPFAPRSRLVVDDPGCSRRQKFALSCSDSLIPERPGGGLVRGRIAGGRKGVAGGVELGVIGAFVWKCLRGAISASGARLFVRRKSSYATRADPLLPFPFLASTALGRNDTTAVRDRKLGLAEDWSLKNPVLILESVRGFKILARDFLIIFEKLWEHSVFIREKHDHDLIGNRFILICSHSIDSLSMFLEHIVFLSITSLK